MATEDGDYFESLGKSVLEKREECAELLEKYVEAENALNRLILQWHGAWLNRKETP